MTCLHHVHVRYDRFAEGVVHTHATALWACVTIGGIKICVRRSVSPAAALFHVGALTPATLCVHNGGTLVNMRSFAARLAWELIDRERINTCLAVPAMLNFMLQVPPEARGRTDSMRWCMSGAAPVPVSLIQAYADIGIEIIQIYGLTETCGPACIIDSEHALSRAGSTGKSFLHTDVKLVDGEGRGVSRGNLAKYWCREAHHARILEPAGRDGGGPDRWLAIHG